ncbi:MAG: hypothetical protein NVS9B7_29180 [Flavisolibacter sp.]
MTILTKIFNRIDDNKVERKVCNITKWVYSYDQERLKIEDLISQFSRSKNYIDLIETCLIIKAVVEAKSPIESSGLYKIKTETSAVLQYCKDFPKEILEEFEHQKVLADISLIIFLGDMLVLKTAYEKNMYSHDGIIYSLMKAKKGPLTTGEKEEILKSSTQLLNSEPALRM